MEKNKLAHRQSVPMGCARRHDKNRGGPHNRLWGVCGPQDLEAASKPDTCLMGLSPLYLTLRPGRQKPKNADEKAPHLAEPFLGAVCVLKISAFVPL